MLTGEIIQLIHFAPPAPLFGARPGPEHHDGGYGVLRDNAGREVFFAPDVVAGPQGFDDLRRGQSVEFTLDDPFLRAASISAVGIAHSGAAPQTNYHSRGEY